MDRRQQARERSTRALLQAATVVLAERGYHGATAARVAEVAGVSRGLIHYHFASKDDMLARVLRTSVASSFEAMREHLNRCETADQFARELVAFLRVLVAADPYFVNLMLEGRVASRHRESVRLELQALETEIVATFEQALTRLADRGALGCAIPASGLVPIVTALLDGIGAKIASDPNLARDDALFNHLEHALLAILSAPASGA